ncbi:MAG: hypothetical protein ACRD24_07995 [Terriglobales bacterium]
MNGDATPAKPARPTWRQALVLLGGGTLLASSACYGVFENESNDPVAFTFSALFVIGMVLALVGVIMVIVRSAKLPPMSDPAAPPATPRPAWSQTLIMLASGIVLGASSCYGFLETLGGKGSGNLYGPFATGFYIGCLITLGGLIMALIRGARSLSKRTSKGA